MKRPAVTLIEFLVVLGILMILLGILVVAVFRVRTSSETLQCKNHLKQIGLGWLEFSKQDYLVKCEAFKNDPVVPPHTWIMEVLGSKIETPSKKNGYNIQIPDMPIFRCPTDFTMRNQQNRTLFLQQTSYPCNALAFKQNTHFPNSITDGVSNTVGFSERYGNLPQSRFDFVLIGIAPGIWGVNPAITERPATFADERYGDNLPIHDTASGACLGSKTGITFLSRPTIENAQPGELITGHAQGIHLAFLDGSVRSFGSEISQRVFWAHATPASGD